MDNNYYTDIISSLAERTIKRLWIVIILLVILLFGSNAAWIYYESQWAVVESTVTQEATADDQSDIRLVGGDYYGGAGETDGQNKVPTA